MLKNEILEIMFNINTLYKTDLLSYIANKTNPGYATKLYKQLINEHYIYERDIIKHKGRQKRNDQIKIATITYKGKNYLIDKEFEKTHMITYYENFKTEFDKPFKTTSHETLYKNLGLSKIKMFFKLQGIPVFPKEKPSLLYLVSNLSPSFNSVVKSNPMYLDTLDKAQLSSMLKKGIFYSSLEYRNYLSATDISGDDVIPLSRFKGIYVSNDKLLVIYLSNQGANKILRVYTASEERLFPNLERTFSSFTNIYRKLPMFTKQKYGYDNIYFEKSPQASPYALVLSDGYSLAYSMATGYAHGKSKSIDAPTKSFKNKAIKNQPTFTWLTGKNSSYKHIFVVPTNTYGVEQLSYLLNTTYEQYYQDIKNTITPFTSSKPNNDLNPIYQIVGKNKYAIYLPVLDVKILNDIYERHLQSEKESIPFNLIVLAPKTLLPAIAHSIKQNAHYVDTISKKECKQYIYDHYGCIAGQHSLMLYLKKYNQTISKSEIAELPKRFNTDAITFWNNVASNKYKGSELISKLNTDKYIPEKKKYRKTVAFTLTLPDDIGKAIKQAAKNSDINYSAYLKSILFKNKEKIYLDADNEKQ